MRTTREQGAPGLKIVIDLDAAERMYMRLIDVHRFGDWRLFFDDEVADAEFTYSPENTPPWIIHREDLEAINALHRRLAKEVAHGNRLNFGAFGVGLHMSGGFRGANAPFDEKRNAISVCLIPGKEIKASVKALKPINVTEDTRWYVSGTLQHAPQEVWDQLVAEGPRQFEVTGLIPPVHPSQPDEGVWLEDDSGEKVAVATVVSSALSHTDCTLDGSLERGDYWIVIQCRYQDEPGLIRCRRRIRVV